MTNIVAYREVGYKSSPAYINKILLLFYKGGMVDLALRLAKYFSC